MWSAEKHGGGRECLPPSTGSLNCVTSSVCKVTPSLLPGTVQSRVERKSANPRDGSPPSFASPLLPGLTSASPQGQAQGKLRAGKGAERANPAPFWGLREALCGLEGKAQGSPGPCLKAPSARNPGPGRLHSRSRRAGRSGCCLEGGSRWLGGLNPLTNSGTRLDSWAGKVEHALNKKPVGHSRRAPSCHC